MEKEFKDFEEVVPKNDESFIYDDVENCFSIDNNYYDGSIKKFLEKVPEETILFWENLFPNFENELEENIFYRKLPETKQTILHMIAGYYHSIDNVLGEDNKVPYELLEKNGTLFLKDKNGLTPFHLLCENADWGGVGPTRYLQDMVELYIKKNYPDFSLSSCYDRHADEDKLYRKEVQDEIINHAFKCNAEKFIERL